MSCRSGLSLTHSLFSLDALLHVARSTPRWCHHFSSWSISKRSVYIFPLAPFTYHCNRTGLGFLFGAIANHRLESVEKYQHEVRAWEEPPGFFVLGKFGSLEMHKKEEFRIFFESSASKKIRITEYRRVCKGRLELSAIWPTFYSALSELKLGTGMWEDFEEKASISPQTKRTVEYYPLIIITFIFIFIFIFLLIIFPL